MDQIRREDQCIELERGSIIDSSKFFSVREYQAAFAWAERLSNDRARDFHDVSWTEGAPRVEQLAREWQSAPRGRFRICDWDVYDSQMRRLLGIL